MVSSSVLSDDDYDVVSNPGQRSVESSMTDFGHIPAQTVHEPPPSQIARDKFETVSLTAPEIQVYTPGQPPSADGKMKRVYVDGIFDGFNAGHALQLRQAKLSLPSTEQLRLHGYVASIPHVERCEVLRHCRWVDEVMIDVPWELGPQFIDDNSIDYVALDEGASIVIPTRKTTGLTIPLPVQPTAPLTPITPEELPQFDVFGIGY
ncbi:cholinephosphate cytidylyltransferase [Lyophyllum atratum]|nr:cholinephosphate cytidylyltransferase [Lyophyllum atratum]